MLRWRASHLFDLFDHDSAALSSSFFLPPNAGWCLGRVIWNTAVGQQLELGSWRPYGLCSFPRWWANSAEQVCTTGTSLIVKWHAMRAFTGLVSDTPEKQLSEATHPNINGIGYCTPWYNCLQIASKDILVFLDSCICLWIYPSARIACAEPKVWICDAMRPVTGQEVIQRTTWWSTQSPLATDATGFFCPCFSWIAANSIHQNKHGKNPHFWLVVWNMNFIFPYIGHVIIPTDELIFFRGVGIPPARFVWRCFHLDPPRPFPSGEMSRTFWAISVSRPGLTLKIFQDNPTIKGWIMNGNSDYHQLYGDTIIPYHSYHYYIYIYIHL